MSYLSQFSGGQRRITQIVGSNQLAGGIAGDIGAEVRFFNAGSAAGQLQTVLSITGAGALNIAAATSQISNRQIRLRITLDGVVVLDRAAATYPYDTLVGIGFPSQTFDYNTNRFTLNGIAPHRCHFASSCLVEASTSQTGGVAQAGRVYLAWEIYE